MTLADSGQVAVSLRAQGDGLTPSDAGVAVGDRTVVGNPIRRNLLVLAGGQAATFIMSAVFTVVVPRVLGPTGVGLIASVAAVVSILGMLVGLGTTNYLSRELAAHPQSAGKLVGTALALKFLMAPVFVACAFTYAHFAGYGPQSMAVMALAIAATFISMLDEPLLAAIEGRERMEYTAYSGVLNNTFVQGPIGIVVVVFGLGVVGLEAVWVAGTVLVLILGLRWIRPMVRIEMRTTVRQIIQLVRRSVPFFASSLFFVIYIWIDMVVLSLLTSNEVVGWYAAPTKLLGAMLFLPMIAEKTWKPRLTRTFETKRDEFAAVAEAPIGLVMTLSLPLCAASVLGAGPIIRILFGGAFNKSVPVMMILGVTAIPLFATSIFAAVLIASRKQVQLTVVLAACAVINPTLNYFLIQFTQHRYHNGAIGAAACLMVTEFLTVAADLYLLGPGFLSKRLLARIGRTALATAGMFGVGYVASPLGWYLSLPLAGATFVGLAGLFGVLSPEERKVLSEGLSRIAARLPGTRRQAASKK
jgi:O-antigen/teichoic acid export membrane protein